MAVVVKMKVVAFAVTLVSLGVSAVGMKLRDYSDRTFTVVVPPNTPDQCYHIPDIKFRQDVDVFFQVLCNAVIQYCNFWVVQKQRRFFSESIQNISAVLLTY